MIDTELTLKISCIFPFSTGVCDGVLPVISVYPSNYNCKCKVDLTQEYSKGAIIIEYYIN